MTIEVLIVFVYGIKKCTKVHINECPDYEQGKKCPRGNKCPLIHRKASKAMRKPKQVEKVSIDVLEYLDLDSTKGEANADARGHFAFSDSYISFGRPAVNHKCQTADETKASNEPVVVEVVDKCELILFINKVNDRFLINPKL